jgi:2,3-diketo-5-methylthio-1-phosphopentane phosphatase
MNNCKDKFIFISDFDGTLTNKDFYQIIIDNYLGDTGADLYKAWKRNEYKDIDFLDKIFTSINRSEALILEDILNIPFDPFAKDFIGKIKSMGGDFAVLSAGTSYYIHKLFNNLGILDVDVYSNEGYYKDNGIHFKLDKESPFYSEVYGIDKEKVVKSLKEKYEIIYFAGDSAPDMKAAKLADITFAKGVLQELLSKENHPFIPVNNFKEIEEYLIKKGVLNNEN